MRNAREEIDHCLTLESKRDVLLRALGCSWLLLLMSIRHEIDHCVVLASEGDKPERRREEEEYKKRHEKTGMRE